MSSTLKEKIHTVGLTEVYCPQNPQVDVVFVHGLNGHPYNTWATHGPEVFWPAELLPECLKDQQCRVLTAGYDANVTSFTDGTSKDHIHNHAEHLAARLVANRGVNARERPIVFVAHSLGGLVVKRLLIYCENINNPKLEHLRSIYVSTFGILFLGTPHTGSDLAKYGSVLQSICAAVIPKKLLDSSPQLVNSLKSNNETLQNINRLFIEISEPFRIYFFHESRPMNLGGTRRFVVEEESAAPPMPGTERMGIEKDHSTMCKFEDFDAPGFDVVSNAISNYAQEAPSMIRLRWEREKRLREYYRQSIASELLRVDISNVGQHQQHSSNESIAGSMSSSTIAPPPRMLLEDISPAASYEIEEPEVSVRPEKDLEPTSSQYSQKQPRVAPLLFRPNSIFVGFDIEIDQLEHKLSSEQRSQYGTTSVLICGPPGSGKSHLARQYVWTHQVEYPAGIFWVDCKSRQNMDRYFWDIGQALGCLEGQHATNEQSHRSFISEVRQCLESLHGWLLVFDGIFFDSDEALSDIVPYLPDSAGNSIIYTSIDPTLKNRHRLLSPAWIRVRPLNPRAARELLFKSLDIHKYSEAQLRKAQELVHYYRCLPLGIHAAAHMLIAQGRSLEKFSPVAFNQRLAHPFLEILRALERRGYFEAVTLLLLLCFLDHKVPVGLLKFGNTSLYEFERDLESFDRVGGAQKAIDNTISVLLKYGLIERELHTYSVSTPDHSRRSPSMSRVVTEASMADPSLTATPPSEDVPDLKLVSTANGNETSESSTSKSVTIDRLRIHTIAQVVIRDEIQANGMQGLSYTEWLLLACRFVCASYRTAAVKLGSLPGQGSVADYREYKSHIATIWKLLPRSRKNVPPQLASVRKEVRGIFREIQDEIRTRSPSQSQSSSTGHPKYIGSIFETSASSSDEESQTPTSHLTRESTWSSEKGGKQSESPTQYHVLHGTYQDVVLSDIDDDGYTSELDDLTSTVQSSQHWDVTYHTTAEPRRPDDGGLSRALLRAILPGRTKANHQKSLGEFKPMPIVGKVSNAEAKTFRPKSPSISTTPTGLNLPWTRTSTTSTLSAQGALNAVQAKNTPIPTGPSERKRSPLGFSSKRPEPSELDIQPLNDRSTNIPTPATTSIKSSSPQALPSRLQQGSNQLHRQKSTSPRLMNAALVRQTAKLSGSLPSEENTAIARRFPELSDISNTDLGKVTFDVSDTRPTGYMSAPMSRDVSQESNRSLLSVPAEQSRASTNSTFVHTDSFEYKGKVLPSIDVAMARSHNVGHYGGWTYDLPFGLEDEGLNSEISKPTVRQSSISAPMSPNLASENPGLTRSVDSLPVPGLGGTE